MGIGGAVGLLKQNGNEWASYVELKNMFVVIDLTNALYWYVKKKFLNNNHMDHYGSSMVELGALYRRLFYRLLERNVTPIVVLNGGTKSEQRFGPLASKSAFLRRSCSGALNNLVRCRASRSSQFYDHLPELADNTIREIMVELKLEHVVQANYEVYPVLEHWAREKQCPVLTNHSDFIFRNAPNGFIWTEELDLPEDSKQPFKCRIYSHDKMLQQFNLEPRHSPALKTLSVLLRDDFSNAYYDSVNYVLRLVNHPLAVTGRFGRILTKRLTHVMMTLSQNTNFDSDQTVRSVLGSRQSFNRANMLRDYDAIYDTYATYYADFNEYEFAQCFINRTPARAAADRWTRSSGVSPPAAQAVHLTQQSLLEALTQREATAEFVSTLGGTTYSKTAIEDTSLFRSTFSLHDNCRQYLLDHTMGAQISQMRIFDRSYATLRDRELNRQGLSRKSATLGTEPTERLNRETLFNLFHFNAQQLESLATSLASHYGIDQDNANQLMLQLLLARFACNLMYRDHHSNAEDSVQKLTNTRSSSLGSSGSDGASPEGRALYERKKMFLTAIMNSYIYHARTSQGDQTNQDVPADIRVARNKMATIAVESAGIYPNGPRHDEFYRIKHMIEALNSVMHGYKELNSLYNYPGPNFFVSKYYDGVLVYKIMSRWSANLQGFLLRIDNAVLTELIGNVDS